MLVHQPTPVRTLLPVAPATGAAPASVRRARPRGSAAAGAALVSGGGSAGALFNFPGIAAGKTFTIVSGSKVGALTPKGTAKVEQLDATGATLVIDATAGGKRAHVRMTVKRVGDGKVLITLKDLTSGRARIASATVAKAMPNFSQFVSMDGADKTMIRRAGAQLVVDTKIPVLGHTHIRLQ